MTCRRIAPCVVLAILAAAPARADEIARGAVVKVEDRAAYVDLGVGRGVAPGAPIRFKRPIALRNPVTGERVTDWLPLGSGTVSATGSQLARVVLEPALAGQLHVGDVAEVYVVAAAPEPAPPAPAAPAGPPPAVDPATREVLAVWAQQSGQPLAARIAAWEGWLAAHVASPYADAVRDDLDVLRAERDQLAPHRLGLTGDAPVARVEHVAPTSAEAGHAVPLVFVAGAEPPASAWLHYRAVGRPTYHRLLLAREGDIYLRGAIPAAAVRAPGVEYFVEASDARGRSGAAYASADDPARISVASPPLTARFAAAPRRSRLTIRTTYLDFATFDDRPGDHTDRADWTEVDVLYRLHGTLWGVRAGYGAFHGKGGSRDHEWTPSDPAPEEGFNYGYAEAELRQPIPHGPPLGAALRLIAGVGERGFGMGVEGRGRIGDPDGTNLVFTVGGIAEIGFISELRFMAVPRPRLELGMSVGVTDQPTRRDLGVQVATDLGWRVRPWLIPTLRLSWQGRSAAHAGVGGGLGLVFDW
jgi:hypothetical protein